MLQDFKAFVMRGNVLDLAVAVVLGSAFGAIVNSLVQDIIMPPIGLILGKVNFVDLFLSLDGQAYASLAAARDVGAPTLNYGLFIQAIVNFLIIASAIFLVVRATQRLETRKETEAAPATTKECPHCISTIPIKAKRCPYCTSQL